MRMFNKRKVRQAMSKVTNILVVLAMLLSLAPSASLLAAPAYQAPETVGNCVQAQAESGSSLFLPFVSGAQNLLTSAASAIAGPQAAPRTITWEVGKTYTYDYSVEINNTAFRRTVEGPAESTSATKTVVEAEAIVSITSVKDDGTFVGQIVLNEPFICSTDTSAETGSNEAVVDNTEFAAELQKPLIFEQAPTGVITAIQLPTESRAEATNVQKGVINSLQMTLQADSDSYMATEVGGQGTYTATYTLADDGDDLNITKSYGTGSFAEMNRNGDDDNGSMTMNTSFTAKLDGAKGIITSVEGSEVIETGDGVEEPDGSGAGFDGATAWTKIASETALTFVSSSASRTLQSASLSAPYVDGGLGATFPDEGATQNLAGIDLDDVDLDAEIAKLVADPENPEPFMDILDLATVDEGTAVLDAVKAALDANAADDAAASALIDVLTAVGTPYAQSIMAGMVDSTLQVGAASLSAITSVTVTEKALINLVLIDSPTMTTVTAIKNVSAVAGDLQGTAVSVLGATADKLSDSDPAMAEALTTDLLASLNTAGTEEDVALYLGALGNAAQESTADEITEYLGASLTLDDGTILTETIGIQFSAYTALAQIPGETAEGALVAALNDQNELLGTRITILDMLGDRDDLSAAGLAALSDNASLADFLSDDATEDPPLSAASANAPDLSVSRSWNKNFGNSKLGLALPGVFTAKTPPHYNGLYLYAQQKADAKVFNKTINLVDGNLKLWRNTNTTYKFQAKLGLLKYKINRSYERQFTCGWNRSGNLWRGSTSTSFSYSVPVVAIITVGVSVKLGAYASLDYTVGANVCNPANLTANGKITPSGRATASADAFVSLWLVRGGVGVSATIMNTRFDLALNAALINARPKVCVNVTIRAQAISGKVYAFADRKSISWKGFKWKRFWTGNLASFSSPTRTYSIWNNCWQ